MDTAYAESETRHTTTGRPVTFTYRPSEMPIYSLAKAIHYKKAGNLDRYSACFAERTAWLIGEVSRSVQFPNKNDNAEKKRLRENLDNIRTMWMISGEHIAALALRDSKSFQYIPNREKDRGIETVNRSVCRARLGEIVHAYVFGEHARQVVADYRVVESARADSTQFPAVAALCKPALTWFSYQPILGIDPEAQAQEALVVVWKCAHQYQGKNFARFNTLVRRALEHKKVDMIRYLSADCRRIHKMTFPMGGDDEESRLHEHLADTAFKSWRSRRMNGEDEFYGDDKPIPRDLKSDFEVKYAVEEGTLHEIDDTDYPLDLEHRVELITEGQRIVREAESKDFPTSELRAYEAWKKEGIRKSIMNNPRITSENRKRRLLHRNGIYTPEEIAHLHSPEGLVYDQDLKDTTPIPF